MPVHFNQHYQILCKHSYAEVFDGSDRQALPQMISERQKEKILSAGDCFASLLLSPHIFVAVFQATDVLLSGSVQWPIHAASFWLVESPIRVSETHCGNIWNMFLSCVSIQQTHCLCDMLLCFAIAVWIYISSSCRFCFCFFNSLNLNQQPKLNLDSAPDKWNKTRNHSSSRSLLCFYYLIFKKREWSFWSIRRKVSV